jgi:A/G-specific adenine glycosylase
MHDFSLSIVKWYRQNKRDLPWRETNNPYFIWLSEIILQQTRVQQGTSYYNKFTTLFPEVKMLADADEQIVLKAWQGLGYYSRARNLHAAAQVISNEFDGVFPSNYKEIKALKGVGDYTAAAIASFAFDLPHAVVDGNVYRVLSRYFDEDTPYDTTKGKKLFQSLADDLLDHKNPAEHNQAIMELGALICTPKSPKCDNCPLIESCLAYRNQTILQRPVKSKKMKVEKVHFYYLFKDLENIPLEKRETGIWKNMYQLPLVESKNKLSLREVATHVQDKFGVALKKNTPHYRYKHLLSHREIHAEFWQIKELPKNVSIFEILSQDEIEDYPIPRLIDRFFEEISADYK